MGVYGLMPALTRRQRDRIARAYAERPHEVAALMTRFLDTVSELVPDVDEDDTRRALLEDGDRA